MQNDKVKFKNDFKKCWYSFTLSLISFVGSLSKTAASGIMEKQLLRSGTSVIAHYTEASAASLRKVPSIFSFMLSSRRMNQKYGYHFLKTVARVISTKPMFC